MGIGILPFFVCLGWLCITAAMTLGTASAAVKQGDCGGYASVTVVGWLYGQAGSWAKDEKDVVEACRIGTLLEERVGSGEISREVADNTWKQVLLRLGLCDGSSVNERAKEDIGKLAGQQGLVAEWYCRQTWSERENNIAFSKLAERTDWLRKESFCEFVTEIPRYERPELCKLVRDGTLDVDEAMNRWARETRIMETSSWTIAKDAFKETMSWMFSTFPRIIVSVVGLVATIVGIAAGLKKLL